MNRILSSLYFMALQQRTLKTNTKKQLELSEIILPYPNCSTTCLNQKQKIA